MFTRTALIVLGLSCLLSERASGQDERLLVSSVDPGRVTKLPSGTSFRRSEPFANVLVLLWDKATSFPAPRRHKLGLGSTIPSNRHAVRSFVLDMRSDSDEVLIISPDGELKIHSAVRDKKAYRTYVRNQLAEISDGAPLRYARFIESHGKQLSSSELGPHLVRLTQSGDARVREIAQSVLWEYGRDGELAWVLAFAINHDLCGSHVIWLTTLIKPEHAISKLFLISLGSYDDPRVRIAVLEATVRLATDKRSAVDVLVGSLRDDGDMSVRKAAVRLLGGLGVSARRAVPILLSVLRVDKDLHLRLEVARSLQRIEPLDSLLQDTLKRLELSLRQQLRDGVFPPIIFKLEALITEQKGLRQRTQRTYRDRVLADLLD